MTSVITTQLSHQPVIEIHMGLCKNDISSGKNNDRCFSNSRPWLILHSRWHLSGKASTLNLVLIVICCANQKLLKSQQFFMFMKAWFFYISLSDFSHRPSRNCVVISNKLLSNYFLNFHTYEAYVYWPFPDIALKWLSLHISDDYSKLIQLMRWCSQATTHCLSCCWQMSMSPCACDIARPKKNNKNMGETSLL